MLLAVDYTLLVKPVVKPQSDEFQHLLKLWEVARGAVIDVELKISNPTNAYFPGCNIKDFSANIAQGMDYGLNYSNNATSIPTLEPGSEASLKLTAWADLEGILWIHLEADPPKGSSISFTTTVERPGKTRFSYSVTVVSRENLQSVALLEKILEELRKKS